MNPSTILDEFQLEKFSHGITDEIPLVNYQCNSFFFLIKNYQCNSMSKFYNVIYVTNLLSHFKIISTEIVSEILLRNFCANNYLF